MTLIELTTGATASLYDVPYARRWDVLHEHGLMLADWCQENGVSLEQTDPAVDHFAALYRGGGTPQETIQALDAVNILYRVRSILHAR